MASAPPLSIALSVIPSLPRPLLSRLVERAMERLDEIDGDADLEDSWDREEIDEREPETYDGGYSDSGHGLTPNMQLRRRFAT